jgi:hypothetical protein
MAVAAKADIALQVDIDRRIFRRTSPIDPLAPCRSLVIV